MIQQLRTLVLATAFATFMGNIQAAFIAPTEMRVKPSNTVEETQAVESFFPGEDLEFLVKWNGDGDSIDETGTNFSAADASLVTFTNQASTSVDITWDLTSIGVEVWGAVVKAGPSSNIFLPVSELERMSFGLADTIFGPDNQAISHISLIGKTGIQPPVNNVPDTKGTMALLALGLGAVVTVSRKNRATGERATA